MNNLGAGRTVIVVPTFKERDALPRFVDAFADAAPGIDLLIVDDASPDGTADLGRSLAETRPWLSVLERQDDRGLGHAYRAGFAFGIERGYERIGQMDVDLSHPPEVLAGLSHALDAGADLAIGSRYVPGGGTDGWPLSRRVLSQLGCFASGMVLRAGVRDISGGLKLWRTSALQAIDIAATTSSGFVFQVETTLRAVDAGLQVTEVPYVFRDRTIGESKMSPGIALEGIRVVLQLQWSRMRRR